jgi:fibronectin type 3 domain-containing protein
VAVGLGVAALIAFLGFRTLSNRKHQVVLSWDAAREKPDDTVVGYNIYRSAAPESGYQEIAIRVPCCTYSDESVTSGHTYYYGVKSVDSAGHESQLSNETEARIP